MNLFWDNLTDTHPMWDGRRTALKFGIFRSFHVFYAGNLPVPFRMPDSRFFRLFWAELGRSTSVPVYVCPGFLPFFLFPFETETVFPIPVCCCPAFVPICSVPVLKFHTGTK